VTVPWDDDVEDARAYNDPGVDRLHPAALVGMVVFVVLYVLGAGGLAAAGLGEVLSWLVP